MCINEFRIIYEADIIMKRLIQLLIVVFSFIQLMGCERRADSVAKQIISKHRVIYTQAPKKIPVPRSIDAPMLGNGYTGVAISGQPQKQMYYIARNDFWRLKHGYRESFPAVLGKLEISIPGLEGSKYLIEQDLYEAKTWSEFSKAGTEVRFKTYVSATEDLMIVEINLKGEGELNGSVNLELPGKQELADNLPEGFSYPSETQKGITQNGIGYISRAFVEDVDISTKAAYCVVNMAMQFYHSYDIEYIKRTYPFIKCVAAFWENYLIYENGRYVIYNDAIHEGSGGNMNPILSLGPFIL